GAATLGWENVAQVTLKAGQADDTIYVGSTAAGTATTVIGGPGSDTINVGSNPIFPEAAPNLDGIQGVLTIQDETDPYRPSFYDTNTVNLYDQGNSRAAQAYTLSNDTLQRAGAAPIIYGEMRYDYFNLYTGSGGNHVTVMDAPDTWSRTVIYGSTGNDQ